MPLNHYVTLGRSGLRVSPFCLGAMTFGDESWGASVETSQRIIDAYLERGGNFVDTANGYTKGSSEKILGDHLGRHPHKRERVVLATKFFTSLFTGDPNGGGAGRKALVAQCEESLRRLQTDYIDLYWMHCWDVHTPIEETMRGLDDLVRAGKVRYVGFSDTPAWKVAQAQTLAAWRGYAPLAALQIEYSLLERTVEGELVPAARELGLGITPWSPLKFGALSGKYTRENTKELAPEGRGAWLQGVFTERAHKVIDALASIAGELGSTPARVALAWVQGRPGVTSTILGVRSLEQLEDNVAAIDVALRPEQRATLDKLSEPILPFPVNFVKNVGPTVSHGGATVNGVTAPPWPYAPKNDAERA
jgi:aryl-alcohol dehydrogenase-like predicted oxidoreductase